MDKRIGRTIRHYKILERLGSGGMGVVYRAEDTRLERIVALKFLPASLSRDPVAKSRFMQEARAASALDHPNICNIHSIEETEDGQIFIVMAYYEGETVKQKLERGPLPLAEAVDIALRVVEGLARAHESHIVHRDIKPANVIRTNDGGTKILDFGMAKLAAVSDIVRSAPRSSSAGSAGDGDATKSDAFMGTPV
jgi:serine/threonine protein kinase